MIAMTRYVPPYPSHSSSGSRRSPAAGRPPCWRDPGGRVSARSAADRIRADPSGRLAWERVEYSATAGDATFTILNPASLPHNGIIAGNGIEVQSTIIQGGASGALTLSGLKPGTYQLACSLPGHRESRMIATLLVR